MWPSDVTRGCLQSKSTCSGETTQKVPFVKKKISQFSEPVMSSLLCWWQYFINHWADRNPPVQPPYQTSAAPTWKIGDRPGSRQDWPHIDCTMFLVQSKIMRWYNHIEWGSTLYRFGTLPLLASYFLCFSNLFIYVFMYNLSSVYLWCHQDVLI